MLGAYTIVQSHICLGQRKAILKYNLQYLFLFGKTRTKREETSCVNFSIYDTKHIYIIWRTIRIKNNTYLKIISREKSRFS